MDRHAGLSGPLNTSHESSTMASSSYTQKHEQPFSLSEAIDLDVGLLSNGMYIPAYKLDGPLLSRNVFDQRSLDYGIPSGIFRPPTKNSRAL